MTIELGWWMLPAVLTVIMLMIMFKTPKSNCDVMGLGAAMDGIFSLLLLIPILLMWLIYMGVCLIFK